MAGSTSRVRVETVDLDAGAGGGRQIGTRSRTTAALEDRGPEIEAAIVQASAIAQRSLAEAPARDGWRVSTMEVSFGLTLAAEAGVVLSKASAEASFAVTLTIERVPETP
ncbi:CU044_2847 family protein [Streptomyces sp. WMMC500]|uniref:CU044_2847 family protein n=1 Tax=Streptomyces sp. WMMC500 TaxID=3015154 RepID=UPI00248AC744|nr:CU044_2847 family protein [Streptomyces sp. WMMC500]WBB57678.1 CU044_2847 family protein [Streptomyces sp. WMMC500]